MASTIVLWVYIGLLVAGGLVGFLKAGSKISLITSLIFGLLLALCALGVLRPGYIADIVLALLLVVFGVRFTRGKKFMPSGLLVVLTLLTLVLRLVL
jgi:uncharacterized membrane protein (UPF0136 family)